MRKKAAYWLLGGPLSRPVALLLLLRKSSYLNQLSWFSSVRRSMPIADNDKAIPWYTYPAIEFLEPRINRDMQVFEYGSGNSTIWWASRVGSVVSCEHDLNWFNKMKNSLPDNVTYHHYQVGDGYAEAVTNSGKQYDVIIIDGRDRINCARVCLTALRDTGVIVWDNSDRDLYQEGYDFLTTNGFRRIDFSGMGPINFSGWSTSIFYRPDNVIGI